MKHSTDKDIEQAADQARIACVSNIEFCFLCEDEPAVEACLCESCLEHKKVVSILQASVGYS